MDNFNFDSSAHRVSTYKSAQNSKTQKQPAPESKSTLGNPTERSRIFYDDNGDIIAIRSPKTSNPIEYTTTTAGSYKTKTTRSSDGDIIQLKSENIDETKEREARIERRKKARKWRQSKTDL